MRNDQIKGLSLMESWAVHDLIQGWNLQDYFYCRFLCEEHDMRCLFNYWR